MDYISIGSDLLIDVTSFVESATDADATPDSITGVLTAQGSAVELGTFTADEDLHGHIAAAVTALLTEGSFYTVTITATLDSAITVGRRILPAQYNDCAI